MIETSEKLFSWDVILSILRGSLTSVVEGVRRQARTHLSRRRHAGVMFAPGATADRYCVFEKPNRVWHGSTLQNVRMGRHSYCGANCQLGRCTIGRFCSIGPEVVIGLGIHPTDYASTFPGFYSSLKHTANFYVRHDIPEHRTAIIGNDVWIGKRAMVMDGVTVGDGAIIGAGALVTKNVAPYAIVGGVPARLIRYRFSDDVIRQLCELRWWDWSDELIRKLAEYFGDPCSLLQEYQKRNPGIIVAESG